MPNSFSSSSACLDEDDAEAVAEVDGRLVSFVSSSVSIALVRVVRVKGSVSSFLFLSSLLISTKSNGKILADSSTASIPFATSS